jgi:hypothetical protein
MTHGSTISANASAASATNATLTAGGVSCLEELDVTTFPRFDARLIAGEDVRIVVKRPYPPASAPA